jgi:hypothetical protein
VIAITLALPATLYTTDNLPAIKGFALRTGDNINNIIYGTIPRSIRNHNQQNNNFEYLQNHKDNENKSFGLWINAKASIPLAQAALKPFGPADSPPMILQSKFGFRLILPLSKSKHANFNLLELKVLTEPVKEDTIVSNLGLTCVGNTLKIEIRERMAPKDRESLTKLQSIRK